MTTLPRRGFLYTYSGRIAYPEGSPKLIDIAVSLSREGRYAGHGLRFWPVALHTFVVCDLLPDVLKFDGLVHDSPEALSGDIPSPYKTKALEESEEEMLGVMYRSFGVALPPEAEHSVVKIADKQALRGEVYTVGTVALQDVYERYAVAEELVHKYVNMYSYADCLEAGGRVPIEFIRRFRAYKDLLPVTRLLN
jgi:hypothetical protein